MNEDLKPCPFCGADAKLFELPGYKSFYLSCGNNECLMKPSRSCDSRLFAMECWNKRAIEEALIHEMRILEELNDR